MRVTVDTLQYGAEDNEPYVLPWVSVCDVKHANGKFVSLDLHHGVDCVSIYLPDREAAIALVDRIRELCVSGEQV